MMATEKCAIHFSGSKCETLTKLSDKTKQTLHNYVIEWLLLSKEPELTVCQNLTAEIDLTNKDDDIVVLVHHSCYSRITNKEKLNRAKQSHSKVSVCSLVMTL